jgi:hypothetical protein
MTRIDADTRVPALTRRDALTAIGLATLSAASLASPYTGREGGRPRANNRGAANDLTRKTAPFVMSF